MTRIFYTSRSDYIQPGQRIGVGGEGEVYEVRNRLNLVAKLYHEPLSPEKSEKLIVLSRLGTERLFKVSAWPVDVLLDQPNGMVIGFLMNKIDEAEEVHTLHSPKSRLQKFPEASWAFLIYVAANISRAVAAVHDHGLVVGDLNPKNILVTKKATVHLLDCDSFQVTAFGKTYRCEAGFPEYTPPELQGYAFKEIDRRQGHDYFGLAVVLFQLLFVGRHPFSGRFSGEGEMPLERAIRELRFAYGRDAARRQMQRPPGALELEAVSAPLARLFRRAFLSASSEDRPRPADWVRSLETLAKSLKCCGMHSGHYYFRGLADCPWCEIESRARVRLFNFALVGANGSRPPFRLDEIWREIQRVPPPVGAIMTLDEITMSTRPSPEFVKLAEKCDNRLLLAIICSAVTGFGISQFGGFFATIWILLVIAMVVHNITEVIGIEKVRLQTIFFGRVGKPNDSLLEKTQSSKEEAQSAVRKLEQKWETEADDALFMAKLWELWEQREAYKNLSQIREEKLKQLLVAAKREQREKFLSQYKIEEIELGGVWPARKKTLQSYGIKTAADVTAERLKRDPYLSKYHTKELVEWRRGLEQKFVFDPSGRTTQQGRIIVEKEMDEIRLRLQRELFSGPFYLRRMRRVIEENRKRLQPLLTEARRSLAQAETDLEVALRHNPIWPIILVLIISYFFGFFL